MSASELKKAGLQKLSNDELEALNKWLYAYSLRLLNSVDRDGSPTASALESRIDGEFDGWSGQTIFKLDNGHRTLEVNKL